MSDPSSPTPTHADLPTQPWHPLARVGFRLGLAYLLIFALVPVSSLVPPLAEVLGIALPYRPNGSGDTTFNYVELLANVGLAAIVCVLWSVFDRKREAYPRLAEWGHVLLRYYLGFMMFGYGFAKLFAVQFPRPSLETLMQTYGDASPMGLVWTFMGLSPAYEIAAGVLELSGAALLAWRRTATLGAMLCAVVMTNVVLLNYCFDIPVKLLSSHLLLMALVIIALDGRRLLRVLVLNRPVEAVAVRPHFERRGLEIARRVVKGLLISSLVLPNLYFGVIRYHEYGPARTRSPLRGVYVVDEMIENGEPRPGLIDDAGRWRHVIFDNVDVISVQLMDGSFERYDIVLDREAGTMSVAKSADFYAVFQLPAPPEQDEVEYLWRVVELGDGRLELGGELDGRELALKLHARELDFLLTNRGFHWVNETPLNR